MSLKKNIFNFNHIDQSKSEDQIDLYKYYHYRFWCYQKAYKYFKKLNLAIYMSSTGLIVIGTVVGSVTLNPAILASITGTGLALKPYSETKDYKRKIEMSKYAFTTYQKVLLHLRTALRGGSFSKDDSIKELNILDDTIVNFSPLVTKFETNTINNSPSLSTPLLLTLFNVILYQVIDLRPPINIILQCLL